MQGGCWWLKNVESLTSPSLFFLGWLICVILTGPKVKQSLEINRTEREDQKLFRPVVFTLFVLKL